MAEKKVLNDEAPFLEFGTNSENDEERNEKKRNEPVYEKLHKVSKLKGIKINMLAKIHEEVYEYKPKLNKTYKTQRVLIPFDKRNENFLLEKKKKIEE